MSKRIKALGLFILPFILTPLSCLAYETYTPAQCKSPNHLSYETIVQVDPTWFPKHERLQGDHTTCFGFTTQFLAQYFLNKSLAVPQESPLVPSVVDLIIQYRRSNLTQVGLGHTSIAFQRVRNSDNLICLEDPTEKETDYALFFGENYAELVSSIENDDSIQFANWIRKLVQTPLVSTELERSIEFLSSKKHLYTSADRAYYLARCKKRVALPSFNIVLANLKQELLQHKKDSFEKLFEDKLESMLEKGYPVALGIRNHTVTVTGVRRACCGSECHLEWQVMDSLPSDLDEAKEMDYWYPVKQFSGTYDATQILPCAQAGVEPSNLPVCLPGIDGVGALKFAAASDDLKTFQNRIAAANYSEEEKLKLLSESLRFGGIKVPTWLIKSGQISVNAVLPNGRPLLHQAIHERILDFVLFLLKNKANPNQLAADGTPALFEAISTGQIEVMNLLKKFRANMSLKTPQGEGPLHHCINDSNMAALAHLLKLRLDPNETDPQGRPILSLAVARSSSYAVRLLCASGANPLLSPPNGESPLQLSEAIFRQSGRDYDRKLLAQLQACQSDEN